MKVLGVDPSLTSTGIAVVIDHPNGAPTASTWRARYPHLRGHERLARLRRDVMDAARGADLLVIEGLSYSSRGGSVDQIHGLWWLLTHALWGAGVPVTVVPPSVRAKYATGKGNAGKDEVLLAVSRRYPVVDLKGNDEADALILASMGARQLGHPLETSLPLAHLAAMDSVAWPELASA